MTSTFSFSVSPAPSLSPSLPILVLYLDSRLRVISFQLGTIFEIIFWEEAIRIETLSSPSSPGVHSSLFRRLENMFIAPAVRRQCLWRIWVKNKAAREKTKKADRETKNSQAFTSIQIVKWCCFTYISEASGHFCCFCLWREEHSNFLFKSTHYWKE